MKISTAAVAILKEDGDVETSILLRNADGSVTKLPVEVVISTKQKIGGLGAAMICSVNDLGQPPATGGEASTHHQPLK